MVREENVKLMSRIAIYEKTKGKEQIPISRYYKGDYVRMYALKTVVCATIAYVLIIALGAVYKMDDILLNILNIQYRKIGAELLILYGIWVFIFWIAARILYARRYESIRSDIIIYNHDLKKLEEAMSKDVVKARGGVVVGDDFIDY